MSYLLANLDSRECVLVDARAADVPGQRAISNKGAGIRGWAVPREASSWHVCARGMPGRIADIVVRLLKRGVFTLTF